MLRGQYGIFDVRNGFKPRYIFEWDLNQVPVISIEDVIPSEFIKGDYVHDTAVAASILRAMGYLTDWQLERVAEWVECHHPKYLLEIAVTCKKIAKQKK